MGNCCQNSPVLPENLNQWRLGPYIAKAVGSLALWILLYWWIEDGAHWLVVEVFGMDAESRLADALVFFLYDTAKILLLLTLMVYLLSWIRAGMNVDAVRKRLSGINRFVGYLTGSVFGAVTPFCSCSSIPLFLGFTTAGIPLGITMSFLITSPIINEVAVVVLWSVLGWKLTLVYVVAGLSAGIIGGMLMDALCAERWLQPFVLDALQKGAGSPVVSSGAGASVSVMFRHQFAWQELKDIMKRTAIWVVLGVGLGAVLHGFVPDNWFAENLSSGDWWTVPVSVVAGIPLYTNVTGVVPVMESLLRKGLPLGTTLAFMMSTVAASLPEFLMLGRVMRRPLLAVFFGVLVVLFTLLGWLLNSVQPFIL